jgi:hypothetical protein
MLHLVHAVQVLDAALAKCVGVVVRRQAGQIDVDHQLKLRIANAIHTAMVYFMVSIPSVFIFNQQPQLSL